MENLMVRSVYFSSDLMDGQDLFTPLGNRIKINVNQGMWVNTVFIGYSKVTFLFVHVNGYCCVNKEKVQICGVQTIKVMLSTLSLLSSVT
jgi:hypothetical protein